METRLYECNVIGDGTEGNPYRPSVADVPGVGWSWQLSNDPLTGVPLVTRNSVKVTAKSFDGFPSEAVRLY